MKKLLIWLVIILMLVGGIWWYVKNHKGAVLKEGIKVAGGLAEFSNLDEETKQKFGKITDIADAMLVQDNKVRRYMLLLQNNMELRPGGGFLGQYAVVEVKNGEVVSYKVEDANNLDNSYKSDRDASLELQKYTGIKKWKLRDSNFSPNFPSNVEDALHFYGLAGENIDFAGVFAVNVAVLEDVLKITGPITIQMTQEEKAKEFTSENVLIALEDAVEEKFLRINKRKECENKLEIAGITEEKNGEAWRKCRYDETGKKLKKPTDADVVNRKQILGKMAGEILKHVIKKENFEPLIILAVDNLKDKDIQLWFKDENLQKIAQENNWAGEVDQNWNGDFVMIVDANLGALKSDYYMKREMEYIVDFSGSNAEVNDPTKGRMVRYLTPEIKDQVFARTFKTETPLATARMIYTNTAKTVSYRNSDYHCFTRLFVPEGSKWYIREWFETPLLEKGTFSNKQDFAYKFDVLLGDTIPTMLQYSLPDTIKEEGYKLKVQKQSGIGSIPLKVTIIGKDGKKYTQEVTLDKDLVFELKEENGEKKLVVE